MSDEFPEYQHKPPKTKNYREKMLDKLKSGDMSALSSFGKKKRKRLKPVSSKEIKRQNKYAKSKPLTGDVDIRECCYCGVIDVAQVIEKHHPYGTGGDNIYKWVYLCGSFGCGKHSEIHENPNKAFEEGWLQPEYRGLNPENFPNHPKPWKNKTQ